VALALPQDHFGQYFTGGPHWFGKPIHYAGAAGGTGLQGGGPHTDWNFLTLLLQDGTGGLQARPAGAGRWIDVPPAGGALVVNIGEMLEVATHGYLVATPPPGPAVRTRKDTRLDRLLPGPPAGRLPGHSATAAPVRRAGPRSQPVRP
jgi:isopenicillin N synthase-like dioxygenase